MKVHYRDYCHCCASFAILRRYVTNDYFCHHCSTRITRALRRLDIDPCVRSPDLVAIRSAVEQAVSMIQQESATCDKVTAWDWQSTVKRWRPVPHKP